MVAVKEQEYIIHEIMNREGVLGYQLLNKRT